MHGTRRRAASGNRRIALSKRSLMQPILHLLQLYLLLAILLVLPRSCLGSVPICAASGGFTLARQLATPHLPHARATSGACEHAFAGEVAQPQANSSARDVAARSLASPRIARVGIRCTSTVLVGAVRRRNTRRVNDKANSVRRSLLGRVLQGRRDCDRSDLDGNLGGNEPSSSLDPIRRRELQVPSARPVGHHVNQLGDVLFGLDAVQLTAGDEGEEVGSGVSVVVGAEEQPSAAPSADRLERSLTRVVVHAQAPIAEEVAKPLLLPTGVSESARNKPALGLDAIVFGANPVEEFVDERLEYGLPLLMTGRRRQVCPRLIEFVEFSDAQQSFAPKRMAHHRRFPHPSAGMSPATYFNGRVGGVLNGFAAEQSIVYGAGVGLDVAGKSTKHLAHRSARVFRLVLEQDVLLVRQHYEKVALAAGLPAPVRQRLWSDRDARRISRQTERGPPRVVNHRQHYGSKRSAHVLNATSHRASG